MAVLLRFFASLLDILYLCDAFGDASQVKAAAQHSTSELGSAFALHFTCQCHERETAYRWQREGQSLREKGRNAQNGKNNTKTKLLT